MKAFFDQRVLEIAKPSAAPVSAPTFVLETEWLQKLWRVMVHFYERYRQRRALLELDEQALKDIGVSAADAWREGHLPFWQDSSWRPGS